MKEDTTMKKTYIAPTIEVIAIQTQQMIAMSAEGGTDGLIGFGGYDREDEGLYDPD